MLHSPEYLTIVIEFSIGLAGFSAIVSAFLNRSSELTMLDRHRVTNLLSFALVPGFVALSCIGLELLLNDIEIATRLSSAMLGLALVAIVVKGMHDRKSLPEGQLAIARMGLGASVFIPIAILNALAQILVVIGFAHASAVFFFGLTATLLSGTIQFGRIILLRTTDDT